MRILLFVGAGASVELGVPAMYRMAEGFRRHVQEWDVQADLVAKLMPEDSDIEDLIERLDHICSAISPLQDLGLAQPPLDDALSVQAEVEWYVQHMCERLLADQAELQWGSLLSAADGHELVIATTNYDRAIEQAANRNDVKLVDGFDVFGTSETAPWIGFDVATGFTEPGTVSLLKLHGSTDWYELASTGDPVKLRHPMPLFAGASLNLPSIQDDLRASLILPSREKRVTKPPYLRLSQAFLNAADQCEIAIFLGTSLRDPHIRQAAASTARGRPTFMVSRIRPEAPGLDAVLSLSQTASRFLISTLPYALQSPDPVGTLRTASESSIGTEGILPLIARAVDESVDSHERCAAIERLEELSISIEARLLENLITDPDPLVARFALGLVPLTATPKRSLESAQRTSLAAGDARYQEELRLLEKLLG